MAGGCTYVGQSCTGGGVGIQLPVTEILPAETYYQNWYTDTSPPPIAAEGTKIGGPGYHSLNFFY